jgi:hypothetical protein
MAKETGTAANYLDLMVHLRDFLITSVGSPSPYAVVRDTTPAGSPIAYPSPETQEMIFRGDASNGGSPTRYWYFGIRTLTNGATYWNWEVKGFTGFNDGSPEGSVVFEDQPGANPNSVYTPLQNTTMTYWFWANERRVIVVVKTGTAYQMMYAGFLNTFGTELEYPYPLIVAGSSYKSTQAFNDNSGDFASVPHSAGNSTATPATGLASAYIRFIDGQWYPIKNFYYTTSENRIAEHHIFPTCQYNLADSLISVEGRFPSSNTINGLFFASTPGGTPTANLLQTPGSPDDITSLWPCSIVHIDPSYQFIGQIDSLYWLSAAGGITSEDEIIDKSLSPQITYKVFQNVHRTDNWMFYAIKDE